ncbi:asparagine synthase-related protein [Desulfocucumis palustris]|nr:asparagine synthase-related protein [Desulfocucumis palustris]
MSAICGIYHYEGKPVTPEIGRAMMREMDIYHADAAGIWQEGHVFLGCHAQHITPESVREILPYHDGLSGLSITADAIIDNRAELCDKLGISNSNRNIMTDSHLILQAYGKWGQDCPKYLVGDFAFVIWDCKRQQMFCVVDPTGARAFYYYLSARHFAFSTLLRPLFVLPEIAREHNETWIADFLAIPSVKHQLDPELTLYKNIYLLPAGYTLTVWPDGVKKQVYWQVERQPELKLKSDGEYEEALREILAEAVRCRLRSIRPVGVMMSGGLDSTSVACLAARELARGGRRLLAFSAVPLSGYRDWLPTDKLADETPYIEAVSEHAGNIDVAYCRFEGKHSLSDTDRLFAILEQPYKILENLFWVDGIMAAAQEQNVGVILNGAAGNATISWGDFSPYLLSLLRAGQWHRLFHESWTIARRYRRPIRAMLKLFWTLLPYNMQKSLYWLENRHWSKNTQDLSPINPDFARRSAVPERFLRFGHDLLYINRLDSFETRQKLLSPAGFSHRGVITTKHALAYRMASRDPTMDKRVIEFCLSLPEDQYVRNGRDRFILRRTMAGILPDKVRLNDTVRGKQSADLAQRLQPFWHELTDEIRNIGRRDAEREYLDVAKVQSELIKFNMLNDDAADDSNLRMLLRSLIFSRFLKYEDSGTRSTTGNAMGNIAASSI